MKIDDFLVDFFPKGKEVLVDANLLQEMVRMFKEYENIIRKQQHIIDQKDMCIEFLRADLDEFKNGTMKVDLRG